MASHNENNMRLQGTVVSSAMDKSVVVKTERRMKHPVYHKYVRRTKKYIAHDQNETCTVGDLVEMIKVRPLSKTKNWAITKILVKAK